VRSAAEHRAGELEEQRQKQIRDVREAETDLEDFRALPARVGPWVLFGLMMAFLVAGCLSLLTALVRVWWGARSTTPYFATACASLFLCLLTVMLARQQGPQGPRGGRDSGRDFAEAPPGKVDLPASELDDKIRWQEGRDNHTRLPQGLYAALPQERLVAPAQPRGKEKAAEYFSWELQKEASLAKKNREENKFGRGKDNRNPAKPETFRGQARRFEDLRLRQMHRDGADNADAKVPSQPARPTGGGAGGDKAKPPARKGPEVLLNGLNLDAVPVEYAYLDSGKDREARGDFPETVLWSPVLEASHGSARVAFDLPAVAATYRILVYGHSPDGRLGVAHEVLQVPPAAATKEKRQKPR
jgi:Alpha-2-macroglobulin family